MALSNVSALSKDKRTGKAELQHRHFATIAAIISDCSSTNTRRAMARHFADSLPQTNIKFDRDRFLAACGEENL